VPDRVSPHDPDAVCLPFDHLGEFALNTSRASAANRRVVPSLTFTALPSAPFCASTLPSQRAGIASRQARAPCAAPPLSFRRGSPVWH